MRIRKVCHSGPVLAVSLLSGIFAPAQASALSFVQVVGLFHIVVGILLTVTLMVFFVGVVAYVVRFNTWPNNRDEAIRIIEWAIAMLFVLLVLLSLVNYFQNHSEIALPILAFIVVIAVAILVVYVAAQGRKKPSSGEGPDEGR